MRGRPREVQFQQRLRILDTPGTILYPPKAQKNLEMSPGGSSHARAGSRESPPTVSPFLQLGPLEAKLPSTLASRVSR